MPWNKNNKVSTTNNKGNDCCICFYLCCYFVDVIGRCGGRETGRGVLGLSFGVSIIWYLGLFIWYYGQFTNRELC